MHRSSVLATTLPALALAFALPVLPARADDASLAIAAAQKAYAAGNLKSATESLTLAIADIRGQQQELLKALLPPAPKGYKMTINNDFAQGFALAGGGTGIEAEYDSDNDSFRLDITVDNPIIATMAPMLSNAAMMSAAGKVDRIDGQLVLESDQSLATLVDNRILVQMQDGNIPVMLPVMKQIDFAALAKFDQK
jgi:hypothetical protein